MSLGTLIFSFGAYCSNVRTFYLVSVFARMLQGIADAMISISVQSIVASEFSGPKQEIYIAYTEMAIGAGLCFGPFLGAIISVFLNY
jgi:MFS family permease